MLPYTVGVLVHGYSKRYVLRVTLTLITLDNL